MPDRPNILFILADQLRARSLPVYGERQIQTPHIDRLAREGVVLSNAVATCPVCTPHRSMLLTGRHPQTIGHVINFVRTRHDEIGIGDAFARAGYRTGWVGKWHLHTGSFPHTDGAVDYVPEGRDRLGFDYSACSCPRISLTGRRSSLPRRATTRASPRAWSCRRTSPNRFGRSRFRCTGIIWP